MPAKVDLTGQRFGRLVALSPINKREAGSIVWKCLCDCGNISFVKAKCLRDGHNKSCGCIRKDWLMTMQKANILDVVGQRFGRLVAIKKTSIKLRSCYLWHCKCDCGNIVCTSVGYLNSGVKKSCGCLLEASRWVRHTPINPMDVPFAITDTMKTRREVKKAIKQAS